MIKLSKNVLFILVLIALCAACKEDTKYLETVKVGKYDEFVRNPVTRSGPIDSVNVAKIVFDEEIHNFGIAAEGGEITHTFKFTNEGKTPLLISEARSTCGCTVPNWPKEPIEPGESNEINVRFNTKNRVGYQDKAITLYTNTFAGKKVLRLQGEVKRKEDLQN